MAPGVMMLARQTVPLFDRVFFPVWYAGKTICAIGNGGVNSVVPGRECTKPRSRSKNVVVIGIFIASGTAAAGWVNVGLSYVKGSRGGLETAPSDPVHLYMHAVWTIDNRVFLFIFMGFFPLGFVDANLLYPAEIAPQDMRIHFSAVGTATRWLHNYVIAEITPAVFVIIIPRYHIVYAVIGAFSVPLV
ncbi:hypothetical protein S40288_09073 [Stachybotrys chartarum IBT 40288]|nr:hypothetical protein S40288_09073 [Stachybotrys chartarum IBT 40288]